MSTFDVAVGLDEATLNKALAQLFGHAGFQEKVARGQQTVPTPADEIHIRWDLQAVPTLSFAKPSEARWKAAIKGLHDQKLPDPNLFTLVCPSLFVELKYADGNTESDVMEVHLYAHLQMAGGKVTVDPYGAWVDRATLKEIQFDVFSALVFFGLEMAEKALTNLALPSLPADLGVNLGPPTAVIDGQRLVVGMALSPDTVDLGGATWPEAPLFVLGSHALVNGLVRGQLHRVGGQTFTWRRERLGSPGDGGAAVIELVGKVLEADVQVDARSLTQLGGTGRVVLRGSAVVSLLKAVGLSMLQRILEKIHLSWWGLGYGAQILTSPVLFELGLFLEDRAVKVRLRSLSSVVSLVWPRGSLPTILLSLVLWPLAQLAVLMAPPVLASRAIANQSTFEVFTIPVVTIDLLGKPLRLAASGLSCSTHQKRLLIQSTLDLS
jgi:hypothetical protein